jgi:hygromycin-B 4-O-kinase
MFDGWHYAITSRAHGIGFDDLSAAEVAPALLSLLAALDGIGSMDLAGIAGYGIWTPDRRAPYPGRFTQPPRSHVEADACG